MTRPRQSKMLATSGIGRITQRPEYLQVAATGRKWVTPSFILQAAPRKDVTPATVGFTVSKKVGNAVMRSKARRRLKEAARLVFPDYAPQAWGFVLIGRQAAISYSFEKMCADMKWALAKLAANADLKTSNKRREPVKKP